MLDRWIISKLNELIITTTSSLDDYNITAAARQIESFTINELSLWYIRRSRNRFRKPKNSKELKEASATLFYVLSSLTKLSAPFIPFLSEQIYQQINSNTKTLNSVHLEDWPKINKKLINKELTERMVEVRQVVAKALAKRAESGIRVRQPLMELKIKSKKLEKEEELLNLIKEEVNVKNISFGNKLALDTKITVELEEEGVLREIIRNLQQMRKAAGFTGKDIIAVSFQGEKEIIDILLKNKEYLKKETKAKDFKIWDEKTNTIIQKEVKLGVKKVKLFIKK